MVTLYYNNEKKAVVKNDEILFLGLDLNDYLDEVLGNIVEIEQENGDVLFEKKPAPVFQKIIYLTEVMGFTTSITKEGKSATREAFGEDTYTQELIDYLKDKQSEINKFLASETNTDIIKQIKSELEQLVDLDKIEIKSLDTLIKNLKSILGFEAFKALTQSFVKSKFLTGAEEAEEKINEKKAYNYIPDKDAIDYIGNYTFNNIKGLGDDLVNDLRVQLQIGFMNGEGVSKLKERVKSVFNTSEVRAKAIARTESARAQMFGKFSAYKQSGVKAVKWLLWTDDNRTSDITKVLHAKYGSPDKAIPLDENFKVTVKVGKKTISIDQPVGPFHINERDDLMIEPLDL